MARTSSRTRSTTRAPRTRRSTPATPMTIVLVLGLVLFLWLLETGRLDGWFGDTATENAPAPVATTGDFRAFFTTPTLVYPDRRDQRGDSPLLDAVIADINGASRSIDVATFDFDVPQITNALIAAKQRGVTVRAIVDSENLETPEVAEETGRLEAVDIPVVFDNRSPFMHNKFLVIDSGVAWAGSWNLTENDTFRNNNNMVRMTNREIVLNYTREFEQMFGGVFGRKKQSGTPYPQVKIGEAAVSTYFSPEDGVAQYVLEQIENAKKSVRFMTFSFTSDDTAAAMIRKRDQGLIVEGVFESQNAGGTGSEFGTLRSAGINVLEDGNCYILHHKTIIIDDHIVMTGSYNFTASAEQDNDENLLIIDDTTIAQQYLGEFDRMFALAKSPLRCGQ